MTDEEMEELTSKMFPAMEEIKKMDLKEAWQTLEEYCYESYKQAIVFNGIWAMYGEERKRYLAMLRITFEIDKILEKENKNEKF